MENYIRVHKDFIRISKNIKKILKSDYVKVGLDTINKTIAIKRSNEIDKESIRLSQRRIPRRSLVRYANKFGAKNHQPYKADWDKKNKMFIINFKE